MRIVDLFDATYSLIIFCLRFRYVSRQQLLSVVSLLSADRPNTDSPANVDAAKEVREDWTGTLPRCVASVHALTCLDDFPS